MATVVTQVGRASITASLAASTLNFIGWGEGTTAADAADTALETEAAEARVAGTQSQETTTTTDDTYQVVGTIVATAARAITEAGLFSAATAGDMFVRGDFPVVNLASGEQIQFTVRVQAT